MHITITDVNRVFCVTGARKWANRNGIDFRDFVRNGADESVLRSAAKLHDDQALIDRVIAAKREVENG